MNIPIPMSQMPKSANKNSQRRNKKILYRDIKQMYFKSADCIDIFLYASLWYLTIANAVTIRHFWYGIYAAQPNREAQHMMSCSERNHSFIFFPKSLHSLENEDIANIFVQWSKCEYAMFRLPYLPTCFNFPLLLLHVSLLY